MSLGKTGPPLEKALTERVNRLEGSVRKSKNQFVEESNKATARFQKQLQDILDKNAAALEKKDPVPVAKLTWK